MPESRIYLFGPLRVERDGTPVNIGLRKAEALLTYLAVTGQSHSRDALAALLWPEDSQGNARANLRRALWRLRRALGDNVLVADRMRVGLALDTNVWVDVDKFRRCITEQSTHGHDTDHVCAECIVLLVAADAYYADHFLAGFSLPDCPAFDEWQYFQEVDLREAYAAALRKLALTRRSLGDYAQALDAARRWVTLDTLHESAHRLLMELYAESGQKSAALRQYEECARILDAELHAPPSADLTALNDAILRGEKEVARAEVQPSKSFHERKPPRSHASDIRYELPIQSTSFVGRTTELEHISQRLANPECRLLTLVGPGGIGKTRLAIRAAQQYAGDLSAGALYVPLAAVHESGKDGSVDPVVSAIADALGFAFHGEGEPSAQLLAFLRQKEMLLLLDNMEHLLEATVIISEILVHALGVTVLATSRERLSLRGEWLYSVSGLAYPEPKTTPNTLSGTDGEQEFSAGNLFHERARQLQPAFCAEDEGPAIVRICQLVEGMPLAIELAASWTRVLTCQEIADEIERSSAFLATDLHDVPSRHRSMRGVFEHAWRLLSENEQSVFARLSVFRGGFAREAASEVAGADLSQLSSLVDKSMLQRTVGGRYRLHALLREYAMGKLQLDAPECEVTRRAHAEFYADFLRKRRPEFEGSCQQEALKAMESEAANVRVCWEWAIEQANIVMLNDTVTSLVYYFEYRGLVREGAFLLRKAADALRGIRTIAGAPSNQYLIALGNLMNNQGWFELRCGIAGAHARLAQSVDMLRQVDPVPHWDLSAALQILSIATLYRDTQNGVDLQREALALAEQDGDAFIIAVQKMSLGQAEEQRGEHRVAVRWLHQSDVELERIGEIRFRTFALHSLGRSALAMGRYDRAERHFRLALRMREEYGDGVGIAFSYVDLAKLAKARGRYERATRHAEAGAAVSDEIGTAIITAQCLLEEGDLARRVGNFDEAAQHLERAKPVIVERRLSTLSLVWHEYATRFALSRGNVPEAIRHAENCLAMARGVGHRGAEATALCLLGYLDVARGSAFAEEAAEHLRRAWPIAEETGVTPVALDVLVAWSQLMLIEDAEGGKGNIRELLSRVLRHPAASYETRQRAADLLSASESEVPIAVSQPAGEGADVWTVGAEVVGA